MRIMTRFRNAVALLSMALSLAGCGTGESSTAGSASVHPPAPAAGEQPQSPQRSGLASGLIIALHGKGQSAASVSEPDTPLGQFQRIANRNNMIFVAPQATNGSWGDCLVGVGRSEANDELRILNAISQQERLMSTDAPVYIVGFSGGAGMVARMIRHHPVRFAGAAMISGSLPLDDIDRCSVAPAAPPRLIMIHGTSDFFVPYRRDSLPGLLPSPFRGAVDTFEYFAREAGLRHAPTGWFPLGSAYSLPGSRVDCASRHDAHSGSAIALCTVPGGGHLEPSIAAPYGPSAALLGPQDTTVESADLIWDFLTSRQ